MIDFWECGCLWWIFQSIFGILIFLSSLCFMLYYLIFSRSSLSFKYLESHRKHVIGSPVCMSLSVIVCSLRLLYPHALHVHSLVWSLLSWVPSCFWRCSFLGTKGFLYVWWLMFSNLTQPTLTVIILDVS